MTPTDANLLRIIADRGILARSNLMPASTRKRMLSDGWIVPGIVTIAGQYKAPGYVITAKGRALLVNDALENIPF